MIFDPSVGRPVHAVEHLDEGTHAHLESRLLEHFARQSGLERLTELDRATRQTPLPFQWRMSALDEEHAAPVNDHCADANDGLRGKLPQMIPMTLTTTRFFR